MALSDKELRIINETKEKLYKKLSYTSQDYESIIRDIIDLFRGSGSKEGLTTKWDNISEADVMFIFMSLLAAHKDMLNYMLDYRVQETFMSTAKEMSSVTRIANSFGYKIPGHKASRAEITVSDIPDGTTVTIPAFTTFVDDNQVSWTYLGEYKWGGYTGEAEEVGLGDTIEVFQGSKNTLDGIDPEDFNNTTRTRIINDKSIAIGNNYDARGCSILIASTGSDEDVFDEVDNLYNYVDSGENVYSLGIDPQGLVYIKLPEYIDLTMYDEFTFKYIITAGEKITSIADITDASVGGVTLSFSPDSGSFIAGSNVASVDEVREGFKGYYASANTLATLEDYKNFVINVQKDVPGITKCLVIDKTSDTRGTGGFSSITDLHVGVYVLKEDNVELDSGGVIGEVSGLETSINDRNVSSVWADINRVRIGTDGVPGDLLKNIDIAITLTSNTEFSEEEKSEIRDIVYKYVMDKNIGEDVTASELNQHLSERGYNNFYNGISIAGASDEVVYDPESGSIEYNEYLNIAEKTTDITVVQPE